VSRRFKQWINGLQLSSLGQAKSENGSQLGFESVSRGVWKCIAYHFENAAQRSDKLPGGPILRPIGEQFVMYLGLGVYGHGVCGRSTQQADVDKRDLRACAAPRPVPLGRKALRL
jgi:hypothetical protein